MSFRPFRYFFNQLTPSFEVLQSHDIINFAEYCRLQHLQTDLITDPDSHGQIPKSSGLDYYLGSTTDAQNSTSGTMKSPHTEQKYPRCNNTEQRFLRRRFTVRSTTSSLNPSSHNSQHNILMIRGGPPENTDDLKLKTDDDEEQLLGKTDDEESRSSEHK